MNRKTSVIPQGPVPIPGFHFHFKRDPSPSAPINNGAYEVLGLCWNAEKGKESEEPRVVYRSLSDPSGPIVGAGQALWSRSIKDFFEMVEIEGKNEKVPRFIRVTNPEIYQRLAHIRDQMCSPIKLVPVDAAL